jgi:hypothetical protein
MNEEREMCNKNKQYEGGSMLCWCEGWIFHSGVGEIFHQIDTRRDLTIKIGEL